MYSTCTVHTHITQCSRRRVVELWVTGSMTAATRMDGQQETSPIQHLQQKAGAPAGQQCDLNPRSIRYWDIRESLEVDCQSQTDGWKHAPTAPWAWHTIVPIP
jgi:hypothetical protein